LVFHSSTITMMHGPTNIRFLALFEIEECRNPGDMQQEIKGTAFKSTTCF